MGVYQLETSFKDEDGGGEYTPLVMKIMEVENGYIVEQEIGGEDSTWIFYTSEELINHVKEYTVI